MVVLCILNIDISEWGLIFILPSAVNSYLDPEDFGGGGKPLIISSCSPNLYSLASFKLKQTFSADADSNILSTNQSPLE